jgi:transposase
MLPPHDRDLGMMVAVQAALIAELRAANAALRTQVAELQAVNQALQARVAELERRLGQDSSNSSKPPSQDGLRKPARPARRDRGARRPGKQPGASGAHLAQVANPDEVVVHLPERCAGCGSDLADAAAAGVQARQVFDLPELGLRVTEHRAQRRRCSCGVETAGRFPDGVRSPAQYGPGLRALACYLCVSQHLPVQRAARLLGDVLGASIAAGTLQGVVAQGAAGLGQFTRAVRDQLAAAAVAHFDETGARVAGRLHWVHSASTPELTWQTVHPRRGRQAMDAAGVLPGFQGVAVHDGWSPYWSYDAVHALCGAHLLRELDAVACEPRQGWAAGMAELLCDAKLVADRARQAGHKQADEAARARLMTRYERLLADGERANPPPQPRREGPGRQRQRRSPAARLLARLDAHRDEVLRFLDDLRVPFTNNQAERDLRMVKLQQKISGCWRTRTGAEAFLVVRSYLSTARKQGLNPLDVLCRLFQGNPWLPAPAGS